MWVLLPGLSHPMQSSMHLFGDECNEPRVEASQGQYNLPGWEWIELNKLTFVGDCDVSGTNYGTIFISTVILKVETVILQHNAFFCFRLGVAFLGRHYSAFSVQCNCVV